MRPPPFLRWLPLALAVPAALAAQKSDSAAGRPSRLFRTNEPLVMWLQADFKPVFDDRDSLSTKRHPAILKFLNDKGDTTSLDVTLNTRGHYRKLKRTCSVPGLKVRFKKEQTKGTVFQGQGSLKLSTHCQKGDNYAQDVYVEYAAYKLYNLLTPISLDARLATINWVDPKDPGFIITRPGFWLENEDDMAKRNRGKILMQKGGNFSEMEPHQSVLTDVFHYMIGNTDFSLRDLHNYRIVQTDTSMNWYPMAYDFDFSGLVDAPYAGPDAKVALQIKARTHREARVTDRLYFGGCHSFKEFEGVFPLFKAKKAEMYGVLKDIKGLTPDRSKKATNFLDEFFKTIDKPGDVRDEFQRFDCPRMPDS